MTGTERCCTLGVGPVGRMESRGERPTPPERGSGADHVADVLARGDPRLGELRGTAWACRENARMPQTELLGCVLQREPGYRNAQHASAARTLMSLIFVPKHHPGGGRTYKHRKRAFNGLAVDCYHRMTAQRLVRYTRECVVETLVIPPQL